MDLYCQFYTGSHIHQILYFTGWVLFTLAHYFLIILILQYFSITCRTIILPTLSPNSGTILLFFIWHIYFYISILKSLLQIPVKNLLEFCPELHGIYRLIWEELISKHVNLYHPGTWSAVLYLFRCSFRFLNRSLHVSPLKFFSPVLFQ